MKIDIKVNAVKRDIDPATFTPLMIAEIRIPLEEVFDSHATLGVDETDRLIGAALRAALAEALLA